MPFGKGGEGGESVVGELTVLGDGGGRYNGEILLGESEFARWWEMVIECLRVITGRERGG